MITVIKYLFYKYYKLTVHLPKDKTPIELRACIFLTYNICMNCMFILIIISKMLKLELPERNTFIIIIIICTFLLINSILYFGFFKGSKYLQIIERFSKETETQRVRGNWLVLFYTIFTSTSFFLFYYI